MKYSNYILFLLVSVLQFSCQTVREEKQGGPTTDPISDESTGPEVQVEDPIFQCFSGTGSLNGNLEIFMLLVNSDDRLMGYYFYENYRTEIDLSGTLDQTGSLQVNELNAEGVSVARFLGKLEENQIKFDQWAQGDKTLSVELKLSEGLHPSVKFLGSTCSIRRSYHNEKEVEDALSEEKYIHRINVQYLQLIGENEATILTTFNKEVRSTANKTLAEFSRLSAGNVRQEASEVWSYEYQFEIVGADDEWLYGMVSEWECAFDDRTCGTQPETWNYHLERQEFISSSEQISSPSLFNSSLEAYALPRIQSELKKEEVELELTAISSLIQSDGQFNCTANGMLLWLPAYEVYGYGKDELVFSFFIPFEELEGVE